jgi:hypothetical protein
MKDATLSEMLEFLRSNFYQWCEGDDDFKIAIHYFAMSWYDGMHSNLYKAICEIDANNFPEFPEHESNTSEMVRALEREFARPR